MIAYLELIMMQFLKNVKIVCHTLMVLVALSCNTQTPVSNPAPVDSVAAKTVISKEPLKDSLPNPAGFINDYEGVFTPAERDTLEKMITLFEKETTVEMVIITLDSTITTAESLDNTVLQIARAWGVGKKTRNNGVVIGISKQFRKMRIQNGYGVEGILTDSETKRIIDEDFIPSFKQGNHYEGTRKGLLSLMKKLRGRYTA